MNTHTMTRKISSFLCTLFILQVMLSGCSKDDPKPSTGKLAGVVSDLISGTALENVTIIIFNADNNSPYGASLLSDATGKFNKDLPAGNYYLKLYKQGYLPIPAVGLEAVPFTIEVGQETSQSAEMSESMITNAGYISGKISVGSSPLAGVLVVSENGNSAYSTISAEDGTYSIYNVPAGEYVVKGLIAGYSSNSVNASVSDNTETSAVNVSMAKAAGGKLNGSVRNLAASNKDVDISLVHPLTKETIPGLITSSVSQGYSLSDIPDGTYIARATFKNDERVMDPDRIAKFGEPVITISNSNTLELVFDITGSVAVSSPSNASATTRPFETASTTPTFEWSAYSSTSDYVIEVIDASTGIVIWGGFNKTGDLPVKNITIPSSQTSIEFNSDGNAMVNALTPGKIYRWRVFASKNDQNATTGWTLISASEDQMGLIRITQ
jgi:hypothetical protein